MSFEEIKKQFEVFWTAVVRIRPHTLGIGGFLFALSIAAFYFFGEGIIRSIPQNFIGDQDVFVCWRILNAEEQSESELTKIYVLGGSQVMYGFPAYNEQSKSMDMLPSNVVLFDSGMSSPTFLDSFLTLTHLPIDEKTYVFLHTSPSRMSKTDLRVPQRLGFLSATDLVSAFPKSGYEMPETSELQRWCRQFKILLKSFHKKLDFRPNERWYARDPLGFVAAGYPKQNNVTPGLVDTKTNLVDPVDILAVIKQYVESRGGHLYLLEMPYYMRFPEGMPGWNPDDHDNPEIRRWLADVMKNGDHARGQLTSGYYEQLGQSGLPVKSFIDEKLYGPEDYFDSMHLTEGGREKFLPNFIKMLEQELAPGDTVFQ